MVSGYSSKNFSFFWKKAVDKALSRRYNPYKHIKQIGNKEEKIMSRIYTPSLTLMESKNGYKPSNHAGCGRFLFGNDLCYFFTSSVLVLFIMLRIADLEINS